MPADRKTLHYFHASPHRFRIGQYVEPRSLDGSYGPVVFLTTSYVPHYTLEPLIDRDVWSSQYGERERNPRWDRPWHVYEVEPTTALFHDNCWDQIFTSGPCRVIRVVGNALGIIRNEANRRRIDMNDPARVVGSGVYFWHDPRNSGAVLKRYVRRQGL